MRRRTIFVCAAVFMAAHLRAEVPGAQVEFTDLKPFNSKSNSSWGPVLKDVINHEAPGDSNNYDDKVTIAHETSHGIHAYIRGHFNSSGKKINGFYVLDNQAVVIEEPKMRKSQVGPFVPQSLRGPRYSTYITGQTAWDDTPLYIWDEWVAYTNGGDAGVNQVQQGLWHEGWRDAVAGQIEFSVYAIATAMAAEKYDPNYFTGNKQFREFLAWNLERSMTTFKIGARMEEFKYDAQDQYYEKLRTSSDAEDLRAFTRELFGSDWTYMVLGF